MGLLPRQVPACIWKADMVVLPLMSVGGLQHRLLMVHRHLLVGNSLLHPVHCCHMHVSESMELLVFDVQDVLCHVVKVSAQHCWAGLIMGSIMARQQVVASPKRIGVKEVYTCHLLAVLSLA